MSGSSDAVYALNTAGNQISEVLSSKYEHVFFGRYLKTAHYIRINGFNSRSYVDTNVDTITALTNNPMNLLFTLILIPIVGIFLITNIVTYSKVIDKEQASRFSILYSLRKECEIDPQLVVLQYEESKMKEAAYAKQIALIISIINLIISFVIFISFNTTNQGSFILMGSMGGITLGIDGQSIFFVLLTTLIVPIVILSN